MKKVVLLIGCFCCVFCLLASVSMAEDKIKLKTGEEITGRIINRGKYSLKIVVDNMPYTYYFRDIEEIESDDEAIVKTEKSELTKKKRELILRMIEVNNVREQITIVFNQIINEAPGEARKELQRILKVEDIIDRLVPLYNKHYDEEDLKTLISFYSSPTGAKHLKVMPQLLEDTLQVTLKYFQEKIDEQQP